MFSAGSPSRLPDCGGREAELPSVRLPLLISFSHGDLDTIKNRTENHKTVRNGTLLKYYKWSLEKRWL